jgi:hypothetical protein
MKTPLEQKSSVKEITVRFDKAEVHTGTRSLPISAGKILRGRLPINWIYSEKWDSIILNYCIKTPVLQPLALLNPDWMN